MTNHDTNTDTTKIKTDPFLTALDEKVQRVFGDLSIDKRRLPATKLDKRGFQPMWLSGQIDTIVPNRVRVIAREHFQNP